LLSLQLLLSRNRTPSRVAYVIFTSVFALVFAADITLNNASHGHWTREPLTYIILNALLYVVFIYDAIRRRVDPASLGPTAADMANQNIYSVLAGDFAGLAFLGFISEGLLVLLSNLGIVTVNLNSVLGLHLTSSIALLPDLNKVVALAAAAVTLLLLGIVGVLASAAGDQRGQLPQGGQNVQTVRTFGEAIVHIVSAALGPVLLSLRLVLGPLIWLGSAISISFAALKMTQYLNASAQSTGNVLALLNPFSETSIARYDLGLQSAGLILLAIATVIASLALVEHDTEIIGNLFQILGIFGRTVALTLAIFTFSLALVNAVVNLVTPVKNEPFQVGAFTLLALFAFGVFAAYTAITSGGKPTTA
jgi:hypothetical protein